MEQHADDEGDINEPDEEGIVDDLGGVEDIEEHQQNVNESHLVATVSDLGEAKRMESGELVFQKGQECRECLADLARFLKQDAPGKRQAFFALAKLHVVSEALGPLLSSYHEESDISLASGAF